MIVEDSLQPRGRETPVSEVQAGDYQFTHDSLELSGKRSPQDPLERCCGRWNDQPAGRECSPRRGPGAGLKRESSLYKPLGCGSAPAEPTTPSAAGLRCFVFLQNLEGGSDTPFHTTHALTVRHLRASRLLCLPLPRGVQPVLGGGARREGLLQAECQALGLSDPPSFQPQTHKKLRFRHRRRQLQDWYPGLTTSNVQVLF